MPKGLSVLPAQFGLNHRGKSVDEVRENLEANEIPLGAYEVGIMLLTHPDRLQDYNDLWIDCPGDEYSPGADGRFVLTPLFRFFGDVLEFGTDWCSGAGECYGSASGFLPQYRNLSSESLKSTEYLTLEIGGKKYQIPVKELK